MSKFLKQYYREEYKAEDEFFIEIIGHPYVYLNGNDNLRIEFIAARPLVSVEEKQNGYHLKTDIEITSEKKSVFVKKETNTRYLVYKISERQREIISIINKQNFVVPKAGKDKLALSLAKLSELGIEVYSDMSISENSNITVEEVSADSRIRIQLLPYGDGLKAELFSKPFGDPPPYCKPGKGGNMLIRNGDNNVQFQVKRALKEEASNENTLMNAIQSLESLSIHDGIISFDNPADSLFLLDIILEHSDISVVEWPEGIKYKLLGKADFKNLNLQLEGSGIDWFSLHGELKIDEATIISLQQLLSLTEKRYGRFVELSPGEFIALSDELKKRLSDLHVYGNISAKGVKINKFASIALKDLFDKSENLQADKKWKDFSKLVEKTKMTDTPVPSSLEAELRPYQEEGFRWMTRLATWGCGACLADDMGLGKTIQALAVLLSRADKGPALVVCPLSVTGNWINEVNRFAPSLQVKTLGASNRKQTLDSLQEGDLLITSYGLLLSEEELFKDTDFATIVLDEAHTIKNVASKTSQAIMQLNASFKIALTGTPVQNHLHEIWTLFNFINPGLLGTFTHFTSRFIKNSDNQTQNHLKKLISPFILRRTKAKVMDELPPKTEITKKISLSDDEIAFYEALRRNALDNINSLPDGGTKKLQILVEITKLRQACCNPLLVNKDIKITSSKLSTFVDIINELIENNHRALVFSQFVKHLSIVRDELDKMQIKYQYLDGSTSATERNKRVSNFQKGEGELFLISLKAGGLGLNLTAADYVIHLDPWWNPAVEDQASDRSHRIGQTRPVTIYRLVAEDTIEEKIIRLHNTKRDLADSLLEGSDMSSRLSMKELMELVETSYSQ